MKIILKALPIVFLMFFSTQCAVLDPLLGISDGGDTTTTTVVDPGTTPVTPIPAAPSITSLTISNVTATTADVTVTTSDSDGLSYVYLGAYDASMSYGFENLIYISGTSNTTTTTITHNAPGGTVLYPTAYVYDVSAYWSNIYYDSWYSSTYFTLYDSVSSIYSVSSLFLNSGTVPTVTPVNPVILYPYFATSGFFSLGGGWYQDDLWYYSGSGAYAGGQWYEFYCTAGATYQVNWDDSYLGSGSYLGVDIRADIYDADGYWISGVPVHSGADAGYFTDWTFNNNDTYGYGVCAIYVEDWYLNIPTAVGNQTFAVRVLGP